MAEKGAGEKVDANGNEILEEIRLMCRTLMEKQNEQDILIKNSTGKQVKVLEELQLIRGRLDEVETKSDAKHDYPEVTNSIDGDKPMETEKEMDVVKEPITGKTFVFKHTFKNVLSMGDNDSMFSSEDEHFGVLWKLEIARNDEYLEFYTSCDSISTASNTWTIDTDLEVNIAQKSGEVRSWKSTDGYGKDNNGKANLAWGWPKFITWDKLEKEYLIDGNLTIEAEFMIKKMTGIYKKDLRCFDESTKKVSDISMFLGQFGESKKSEITLTGIDTDDFQNFLEVLYAESALDEFTVEGLLLLADMYDTKLVIQKCEEFLLKETKKSSKTKLRLAFRYNLNELKKKCLSDIKTVDEIRSVIPGDINDIDPSVTFALLEKCLALT